ncbi:hypothetical protein F5X68DRAFT_208873 [Plectosphaerella plurivora]|uniref:Uncharacterized protein n=1 Tax=Plectosphaerella plurivora TaxID=936078 RepID=A0A9P8V915_9PEZI|nr:hypothetical protein F5X68DRAFT_208873 [Plectosphaerella plurivora]
MNPFEAGLGFRNHSLQLAVARGGLIAHAPRLHPRDLHPPDSCTGSVVGPRQARARTASSTASKHLQRIFITPTQASKPTPHPTSSLPLPRPSRHPARTQDTKNARFNHHPLARQMRRKTTDPGALPCWPAVALTNLPSKRQPNASRPTGQKAAPLFHRRLEIGPPPFSNTSHRWPGPTSRPPSERQPGKDADGFTLLQCRCLLRCPGVGSGASYDSCPG